MVDKREERHGVDDIGNGNGWNVKRRLTRIRPDRDPMTTPWRDIIRRRCGHPTPTLHAKRSVSVYGRSVISIVTVEMHNGVSRVGGASILAGEPTDRPVCVVISLREIAYRVDPRIPIWHISVTSEAVDRPEDISGTTKLKSGSQNVSMSRTSLTNITQAMIERGYERHAVRICVPSISHGTRGEVWRFRLVTISAWIWNRIILSRRSSSADGGVSSLVKNKMI